MTVGLIPGSAGEGENVLRRFPTLRIRPPSLIKVYRFSGAVNTPGLTFWPIDRLDSGLLNSQFFGDFSEAAISVEASGLAWASLRGDRR